MKSIVCVFLLTCSLCVLSCCHRNQDSQGAFEGSKENSMIKVTKFSVGQNDLTMDYQLTNPFPYDIWICEDTSVYDRYHSVETETRVEPEMLIIRLLLELDTDVIREEVLAKYRHLSAGQSYSGTLTLKLPIGNSRTSYGRTEAGHPS